MTLPAALARAGLAPDAEAWASLDGQAVAVGHHRAGVLYPRTVFQTFRHVC